jgi:hypothetical protein
VADGHRGGEVDHRLGVGERLDQAAEIEHVTRHRGHAELVGDLASTSGAGDHRDLVSGGLQGAHSGASEHTRAPRQDRPHPPILR